MSRHLIVATCIAAALTLFAGCGGGGKTVDTTSAKTLCPAVTEAQQQYKKAIDAMGLQFENKALETRTLTALEALLLRVRQLMPVATAQEQGELALLATALSNQQKTLKALERHDLAEAAKYGNSINDPLRIGLVDLRKICSKPA
jgi:hypothetical protein